MSAGGLLYRITSIQAWASVQVIYLTVHVWQRAVRFNIDGLHFQSFGCKYICDALLWWIVTFILNITFLICLFIYFFCSFGYDNLHLIILRKCIVFVNKWHFDHICGSCFLCCLASGYICLMALNFLLEPICQFCIQFLFIVAARSAL